MRFAPWLLGASVLSSLLAGRASALDDDEPFPGEPARAQAREQFRRRVYPVLREKCLGCHGDGEELEAALDLRTREDMLRGGKGGPALVPGNPLASLIYQSVRRTDERKMPPKERDPLSPDEVDALRKWIEAGAPWAKLQDRD
jgi:mono/diheme cytochrome c family protein